VRLQTRRLILEPVRETAQPQEFLPVFNSNPDFIEASEQFIGKRSYDLAEVEMYLWQESVRENSRCLAIRLRETGALVGTAALVAPHPDGPYPWIGLLLIDATRQGQGLGTEAATAIEQALAEAGWTEIRLSVMQANPDARRFWERLGYAVYEERPDDNTRPCWLMRKVTVPERHAALSRLLSLDAPVADWPQMEEEIDQGHLW
jgi:RimJ/RimL family protein N-acetyltransferase